MLIRSLAKSFWRQIVFRGETRRSRLRLSRMVEPLEVRTLLTFGAVVELSGLTGANGFKISGVAAEDASGWSVSDAGDINGDGIDDLVIGAFRADPNGTDSGASYVVFGSTTPFAANRDLADLTGANGFKISGSATNDYAGISVSGAGDINGDGFDDLIIAAQGADSNISNSGASFVIFGSDAPFAANLELSALNGADGFRISGVATNDYSGWSVSGAGDVNGDGFDDVVIGAATADPNGFSSGASYVVFGKNTGFAPNLNLSDLDGTNGFRISGVAEVDLSGSSVSGAGDINGDGFDDVVIGARGADANGIHNSGASYVVFGRNTPFAANLELSALDGTNGFRISGVASADQSGFSVSAAGDINGDGIDDVLIGAIGSSYVVFGSFTPFEGNLNLSALDGTNGFRISGVADDYGDAVSAAGDINGDGIDDLIIGAPTVAANGDQSGVSYVVFGRDDGFAADLNVLQLNGNNGFQIRGVSAFDNAGHSVSGAGDINGDGFDDLVIGAANVATNGPAAGASYVVFGQTAGISAPIAYTNGPFVVVEGGSVMLSGTGYTDPNFPDSTITSYEWDLHYDGLTFDVDAVGDTSSFSAVGVDGPWTTQVAFRVTDSNGATAIATSTVTVVNAPTYLENLVVTPVVDGNSFATLTGVFSDVGTLDTHVIVVDWDESNVSIDSTFAVAATNGLTVGQQINSTTDGAVLEITSVNLVTGSVGFSVAHQYLNQSADQSVIDVTVADDDGATDSTNLLLAVPVFLSEVTILGSFTTPGPHTPLTIGNTLYFPGFGPGGFGLWTSDGTPAGTEIIAAVGPGFPMWLTHIDGRLFFTGYAPDTGMELWTSDGTLAGTHIVADLVPGPGGSNPANLVVAGDTLFFSALNPTQTGEGLWTSDGTESGTVFISDVQMIVAPPLFSTLASGNTLYFAGIDADHGMELWKSDGTTEGTEVLDIVPGPTGSNPFGMVNVGEQLIFMAATDGYGVELWTSDGTLAGTHTVFAPGTGPIGASNLMATGEVAVFSALNPTQTGIGLWASDGTEAGTLYLADVQVMFSPFSKPAVIGETLYFQGIDPVHGIQLWKTDGTPEGTVFVDLQISDTILHIPFGISTVEDTLFFSAVTSSGLGFFASDGTAAGTHRFGEYFVMNVVPAQEVLYFVAPVPNGPNGLWRLGVPNPVVTHAVVNTAPALTSLTSSAAGCDQVASSLPVTISGTFNDPDAGDTHSLVIDWGDGVIQTIDATDLAINQATNSFQISHLYTMGGLFDVTVTVLDSEGESDVGQTTAVVSGVGVVGGVLYVIGTDEADHVTINQEGSAYRIHANFFGSDNFRDVPKIGISRIIVQACCGDDHITISSGVGISTLLDGGDGNDQLNAGNGPSILLGGAGDDLLIGGNKRDVLIGGLGADRIIGNSNDDLLISGHTAHDADLAALDAIMAEWNSARDYATRVANIRGTGSGTRLNESIFLRYGTDVLDDGAIDKLTGTSGSDYFIYNQNQDLITDLKSGELVN